MSLISEMNPYRLAANVIGVLLVIGAIVWGILYVKGLREDLAAAKQWQDNATSIFAGTEQITAAVDKALAERGEFKQGVDTRRVSIETRVEELSRHDPTVAEYRAGIIPVQLRQLDEQDTAPVDGPAGTEPGG